MPVSTPDTTVPTTRPTLILLREVAGQGNEELSGDGRQPDGREGEQQDRKARGQRAGPEGDCGTGKDRRE